MAKLTLLLLRHAKSKWGDPDLDDADRPLAKRGREAAEVMGKFIAANGLAPDLVLCSPAKRARATWNLAAAEFPTDIRFQIVDSIYDFGDGSALIAAIRKQGGSVKRLMLVCHNPAIERLAQRLAGSGEEVLRQRMSEKYPTCALAVIEFAGEEWSGLQDGQGRLTRFIRPRDLAEQTSGD